MDFCFYPLRFEFVALDELHFASSGAANTLRGAFGLALRRTAPPEVYERIFEPRALGPSGLHQAPRPFVFRARACAGGAARGERWQFGMNVFETKQTIIDSIVSAVYAMAREGLGLWHSRSELVEVVSAKQSVDLAATEALSRIRVNFVSKTELKTGGKVALNPGFAQLFARIRDRISNLSALYGPGPLEVDFAALGCRAAAVRMVSSRIEHSPATRRSSRTGQIHPLGGFTGEAVYEGELGEFVPFLRAAEYTGVGRQAVWGKGEIEVVRADA